MSKCEIAPISGFQSTNLNSRVDTFNRLSDRILRSLGYPFTNVEIHRDQLYENISIAIEYFTKFAGYTKEYLIFDSSLYQKDYGIKLDDLFTLQTTDTFKDSSYINQYYNEYVTESPPQNVESELMTKINYMIKLLEENHDEKINNVSEEMLLYCFLGVFMIFLADSFSRAGKYVR